MNNTKKPNIIFILIDDLGAREFGCYGNNFNETPNIDNLAKQGILFTQAYSSAAVCSPSRASILTGLYPARTGITEFLPARINDHLDPERFVTINRVLKPQGYRSAVIGKWHLCAGYETYPSPGSPVSHGFDEVIYSEQRYIGPGYYWYPYWHLPQAVEGKEGEYLTDRLTCEAMDFMERNKDNPFFLYFAHYAVHTKLDAPQNLVDHFNDKRGTPGERTSKPDNPYLAAMISVIDNGIGNILKKLDELGIADNTLLVLFSDNGGAADNTNNGELRGSKRNLYEGGIREPLIMRWPGHIKPGSTCDVPVIGADFFPTFAEAAGVDLKSLHKIDGKSLVPLLEQTGSVDRDTLFWHYPRITFTPAKASQEIPEEAAPITDNMTLVELVADLDKAEPTPDKKKGGILNARNAGAMRKGNYKYIECYDNDKKELYDLSKDPSEANDISKQMPELVEKLSKEFNEMLDEMLAEFKFHAAFDDNENYRWPKAGEWVQAEGKFSVDAAEKAAYAFAEQKFFTDSVSEVDVSVSSKGIAGLIVRGNNFSPDDITFRGYCAGISAEKGCISLGKYDNGIYTEIASAKANIEAGKFYRLKVEAVKQNIKVYIDGSNVPVIHAEDTKYTRGTVGLGAVDSNAAFDNLDVKAVRS